MLSSEFSYIAIVVKRQCCSGCWVDVRHLRGVGGRLAHPHHRQQLCKLLQEREEEGANSGEEVKDNIDDTLDGHMVISLEGK